MMKKTGSPYKALLAGYTRVCGEGSTKEIQEYYTGHGIGSNNVQCYTRAEIMLVRSGDVKCVGRKRHENGRSYMVIK